ncbi:polyketide synthase dehydratase domain-containing protein [Streptomyces sp. M19]
MTGTLRRDEGGTRRLLASQAELFVKGVPVDWSGLLPAPRTPSTCPPTPSTTSTTGCPPGRRRGRRLAGPRRCRTPAHRRGGRDTRHRRRAVHLPAVAAHPPWLADHAVGDVVLLPGTGLVELAVRAGDEADCATLDELVIEAPLILPARGGVRVRSASAEPTRAAPARSPSTPRGTARPAPTVDPARHRRPHPDSRTRAAAHPDLTNWPPPGAERVEVTPEDLYAELHEHDYRYGPVFRGLRAVWRRDGELFAEIALPEEQHAAATEFGIHPRCSTPPCTPRRS